MYVGNFREFSREFLNYTLHKLLSKSTRACEILCFLIRIPTSESDGWAVSLFVAAVHGWREMRLL